MPPLPSIISRQFTAVDSEGRTLMVLCNHCRNTRVPRNSLVRKENHLRACQAYHITAAAALQQQRQQQQQQQTTTPTPLASAAAAAIDDTNNPATTATTPGTTENSNNNNIGASNHHDVFDTESPVPRSVGNLPILSSTIRTPDMDILPLNMLENSINTRANRSKPGNTREGRFGALEEGTGGRQPSSSAAEDIYSGVPYAYPLPYSSEPASLRALITSEESRKRRRETGSPGLPNEGASPAREGAASRPGGKRLKYAEFYLDEEDFDFVCDARGLREERFKEIVERLARLVRLRDTRGS